MLAGKETQAAFANLAAVSFIEMEAWAQDVACASQLCLIWVLAGWTKRKKGATHQRPCGLQQPGCLGGRLFSHVDVQVQQKHVQFYSSQQCAV